MPLAIYIPVDDGGEVTGFTISRDGHRVVLAVHDETEPKDTPIIAATLTHEDALNVAAWLRHYAEAAK